MPYISQASIQELSDRLDAITVVSDYLHLEKKGGRFWACCPFHQEKTASFTVNQDMKSYYCFGCHKGGSVINFVMEMDKLSFPETIELLAKKFGVELEYEKSGSAGYTSEDESKKKAKDELFELYRRIEGTFHHFFLKKREAESGKLYTMNRGLNAEMIELFRLGYSPADRYWLYKFLIGKGYTREFLASSGLFSSRNLQLSLFAGRLMFPIRDRQGRTVAFGGRFLPSSGAKIELEQGREPPKYINSPELSIYKKRETLYGLDLALPEIRKTKTAYIAEGYMDVIALHQAGITNTLAPLGTAFTEEQAKLLRRWADKLIFFFDSDPAGQDAAIKGIYTGKKNGFSCYLVNQTDNEAKDPADILKNKGPEALQKKAKCFISDFDYLINKARSLCDIADSDGQKTEGKARAVAFIFPFVDLLDSEVARTSCIEATADAFGLLPSVVEDDYRRYRLNRNTVESEPGFVPIKMNDELLTLIVVAIDYVSGRKEKFFKGFRTALEIGEIDDPMAKEIFIALEECLRNGETAMDELLGRISSPELKKLIVEKSTSGEFSINQEKLVADGIIRIKRKRLETRQDDIIVKLRGLKNKVPNDEHGTETGGNEVRELLAEKMRIDSELNLLKQGR